MRTPQIVKWVAGFTAGLITLIWLYETFQTKEGHKIYVDTHKEWSEQVLTELRSDIMEIKSDIKDIKMSIIGLKVATMLNTNLVFPH